MRHIRAGGHILPVPDLLADHDVLQIGCGIDRRSYAAAYGKHFKKPQLNCGVVLDNGRWALIEHQILD